MMLHVLLHVFSAMTPTNLPPCCCCHLLPAGQLAVGELLLKCMYAAQPDVRSCSQEQLLQLLLLADRYGVPKVLAAVTAGFAG
jgi:hypothetical protein